MTTEIDTDYFEDFPQSIDDLRFTKQRIRRKSFIVGLFGDRGSGKGIAGAYLAWRAQKADKDKKVFYFPESFEYKYGEALKLDMLLAFAETPVMKGEEIDTPLDDSILLIDEAHILGTKYRSASWTNRTISAMFTQIRKKGVSLIYMTNSPNQLDESYAEQTDFHAFCKYWTDPKCGETGKGFHLKECRDNVVMRFVDTQGRYGKSPYFLDGKHRFYKWLPRVINYFDLYNTDALVSPVEIASIGKDGIVSASETAKTGVNYDEFKTRLRKELIPQLVKQGAEMIYVEGLSDFIKDQLGITVSPERIGKACRDLGLESKRSNKGRGYILPDIENIDDWVFGIV